MPAIEALDADVVTLMEIEDTDSTGYGDGQRRPARSPTSSAGSTPAAGSDKWAYVPLPDELLRRRPRRDPQRDHLPDGRRAAGRRPGRPGRRERLVQRPRADRPDLRQGRRQVHGRRQPLQVQEPRRRRSRATTSDTGDGQGAVERRPHAAGRVARRRSPTSCGRRPATTTSCSWATSTPTPRRTRSRSCATPASPTSASTFDPGRYSYVFDELSGSLDHALATAVADAPRSPTSRTGTSTRSSRSPTSTTATRRSTRRTRTAPATTTRWCSASTSRSAATACCPTIKGTNGADVLTGTNSDDVIMGLGGNDPITGAQRRRRRLRRRRRRRRQRRQRRRRPARRLRQRHRHRWQRRRRPDRRSRTSTCSTVAAAVNSSRRRAPSPDRASATCAGRDGDVPARSAWVGGHDARS